MIQNIRKNLGRTLKKVGLKDFVKCPCGGVMGNRHSHASNCIIINKGGIDYATRKTTTTSEGSN
jgi:hypothetical protein